MNYFKSYNKIVYTLVLINIVIIFGIVSPIKISAEPSSGNKVTCYCTLGHWNPGDTQYTVYDCGPCTKVNCSSYTDSGHCIYHASNDNGNIPTI